MLSDTVHEMILEVIDAASGLAVDGHEVGDEPRVFFGVPVDGVRLLGVTD
jgi:hypothetical protein